MAVDSGALGFLDEFIPPHGEDEVVNVLPPEASLTSNGHIQVEEPIQSGIIPKPVSIHRPITKFTHSREPSHSPKHNLSKSRSRPSSRFYAGMMTSAHTGLLFCLPENGNKTPLPPERGPRLLFTSAKTSEGVR